MSKRKSTKVTAPTAAGAATKAPSVGSRAFNRRTQAARQRTVRRKTKRSQTAPVRLPPIRALLRPIPRAAWICALIACLNAICWSILTPPFQIPDEPSHFAYTQRLAETESLPTSGQFSFSPEEEAVLTDLDFAGVRGRPGLGTISSTSEQQTLQRNLSQRYARYGAGGVGGAYSSPPLYYLLQTIPYGLASAGSLLDQLALMRVFSALFGGLTALFAYLFLREALPKVPWAWTVGGLGVALTPTLGYMSGAVNPDAMLFAVSAAIFYCLARAFRHGLTRRLAVAIGVLTAVGFLTKLNFVGLAPGVVLGLIVLTVRTSRAYGRRDAIVSLGIALAVATSPLFLYAFINLLSNHPVLGRVSTAVGRSGSIFDAIGYIWQFYLPRLPGMSNHFPGLSTIRQVWFNKAVGFYGWLDTSFPLWVDSVALVPVALVSLLGIRELAASRGALRSRLPEVIVYGAMAVGLMGLIGASAYAHPTESLSFAEPRYLLPLLPLVGAGLALASRGAGRRWGPPVGAIIVVIVLAHDIFSQMLVAGRYYG